MASSLKNALITGGAGFVGSRIAQALKRDHPGARIVALDNLKRRGSEINAAELRSRGIEFVHGDIRQPGDLASLAPRGSAPYDVVIEASAEPSVLAGLDGDPDYLLGTNLTGTLHCLEFARRHSRGMIFLSTSRVYSIAPLRALKLKPSSTRLTLDPGGHVGVSALGIGEDFPTHLPRSLYGATKLASELVIQEYADTYKMPAIINRCGVLAGPGQFGKTDQGVFTLWVAHHYFGKPLKYTGFGGQGKQVRDLLHPLDLYGLVKKQLPEMDARRGQVFNVGGGNEVSTSLLELTAICREVTGNEVPIASEPESPAVDIPYYVTDSSRATSAFGWKPTRGVKQIVQEIHAWIRENEAALKPLFGA